MMFPKTLAALSLIPLALIPPALATSIPRLSFEQLCDASESIVSGRITQSWTAWDSEHKYIWTHYRIAVTDSAKGPRTGSLEFAEPGGALGGQVQSIADTVTYAPGEHVAVFLARMPNGYLRTTGWAFGKYTVDENGRLHSHGSVGAEVIEPGKAAGTPVRTLEGVDFSELKRRVAARTRGAK